MYTLSLEAGIARPSAKKMMWSADRPKTKETLILRWKNMISDFGTSKTIFLPIETPKATSKYCNWMQRPTRKHTDFFEKSMPENIKIQIWSSSKQFSLKKIFFNEEEPTNQTR
jgi:hypothetical protein